MSYLKIEELKALFQNKLNGRLKLLEKERSSTFKCIILTVFAAGILILSINKEDDGISPWTIVSAILLGIAAIQSFRSHARYRSLYKEKIVKEVISLIDPKWQYKHEEMISREVLYRSNLFDRGDMDFINGDDYIVGLWDKVPFHMSEVNIQKETTDSKGRKRRRTVFHGLCGEIRFNKKINGEVYIFSDQTEKYLGKFLGDMVQSVSFGRGQQVKLENPDFEKNFHCLGTDQVEARYVVTPFFMEKLLELQRMLNCYMLMSFKQDSFYLALAFNRSLCEPKMFKVDTFGNIRELYQDLTSFCMVIDQLKLNQTLWKPLSEKV